MQQTKLTIYNQLATESVVLVEDAKRTRYYSSVMAGAAIDRTMQILELAHSSHGICNRESFCKFARFRGIGVGFCDSTQA